MRRRGRHYHLPMQIRSTRTVPGSPASVLAAIESVQAMSGVSRSTSPELHSDPPADSAKVAVRWPVAATRDVAVTTTPTSSGTRIDASIEVGPFIPYFFWFTYPILFWFARRQVRWVTGAVESAAFGDELSQPLTLPSLVPAGGYSKHQALHLATVGAIGALVTYAGSLLTQNLDLIADTFGASDKQLGLSLAVVRGGILIALVAAALADRHGRRRMLLISLGGVGLASIVAALAPNLAVLTASQMVTRAFVNVTVAVGSISVVEEAPERGRAASIALFGLASSAGYAAAVLLLPLVGSGDKWRLGFLLASATLLVIPHFTRTLRESRRFTEMRQAPAVKRGLAHLMSPPYRSRLFILAAVATLGNILAAPSAQFINRYLADQHGFSPFRVTVFRVVTAGLSGLIGVILGGRFAERYGRRIVGSVGFALMSVSIAWFYLADGPALWVSSTLATFLAGMVAPAMGAFTSELFPTESRGTSNAVFLGAGVLGSVTGLLAAGTLSERYDDLGLAIASLAVVPLVMAVFLIPRLPEPAGSQLDDLSPSIVDNPGM